MVSPDRDPDRNETRRSSGVSLQTLIIASIASAAAAYGASRIWGTGTLISAAITPVAVAIVSELLRRPVQTVATSAKRIPPVHPFPCLQSAQEQARRHGIPPTPCKNLNTSARIRRPPLHRPRPLRSRAHPDASSVPPTAHPAQAPPSPTKLRPMLGVPAGDWPSSPACSHSRSSSRSTPCQTSSPDTPSPATANRRRSSAPRRTRTRKQARRQP